MISCRIFSARWVSVGPILPGRLHELAKAFENSPDETALEQAAQQLYALFRKDDAVREILTRPQAGEQPRSGGINIDSGKTDIGGDVVGRDKVMNAGGSIIIARTGSVVNVNTGESVRIVQPAATGADVSWQNLSTEEIASCFYLLCRQADSLVQQLRLDVAAPDQVSQGQPFELAVAVRPLSSPVLAEDDLTRTKSDLVHVVWPEAEPYVQLAVQVIAPACQFHGPDSGQFRLYAGQDSPVFYFTLTPRQVGEMSLVVKLYQEDNWLGSARVRIVCGQVGGRLHVRPSPAASLAEQARWRNYRTRLREMLEAYFDESETAHAVF